MTSSIKPPDDLEAVRVVIEALQKFPADDQIRIIRWAAEKLKIPSIHTGTTPSTVDMGDRGVHLDTRTGIPASHVTQTVTSDIRSFVAEKAPQSDIQFAATIAYYHRFVAPPDLRKESITGEDLLDACRQANRTRLPHPGMTLTHAHNAGLLERSGRGQFSINAVGENLVAMTLPTGTTASSVVAIRKVKGAMATKGKSAKRKKR